MAYFYRHCFSNCRPRWCCFLHLEKKGMREVNHLKSSDQELGVERNLYFNEVFIESGLTSFVSSQRRRREKREGVDANQTNWIWGRVGVDFLKVLDFKKNFQQLEVRESNIFLENNTWSSNDQGIYPLIGSFVNTHHLVSHAFHC